MEKSTKLIIAAVGLGGLGYFLYKKGLFSKTTTTTTEVAKDVKKVDDVVKSYRNYYRSAKSGFANWKMRETPNWFLI